MNYEVSKPTPPEGCIGCGQVGAVIRDYRAEGVGTNLGELRKSLHPDFHESLFLPEAKDYISKDDPDGSKGIREWNENHEPRSQNKNPRRPKAEKTLWAAPKRKND